jgi:hypothetical protein
VRACVVGLSVYGDAVAHNLITPNLTTRFRATHLLVVILETLGELVDVIRWPIRHFHAEMQTHGRQYFLDLVQ